ncbi:SIMPL domain-containing protein [Lysobacter sp. BMK333-48F3]|uniref:SIMPL domain-containing protein n=1 Tax=Lysobacter sp. BMK333-48F3 TaxID=2867962 RepID=UPI001C8CB16B|nr:SIMPL domain-containing protein [Lysobacter sp. BMK333-48F3]MBX9401542.1 SIMPL domain-containing protein [Lysobacter sp. BMK333-48F3]
MKPFWTCLLALAVAVCGPGWAGEAQAVDPARAGRFHVAGFGRVAFDPDRFGFAFVVVSAAAEPGAARERHERDLAQVRAAIDAQRAELDETGADATGLQRRDDAAATRYRYQTRFVLRLRSREALMRLQQRLAELGVEELDRVQPLSQRLPEYAEQARRLAMQDAQRKAETLAAAAGWRLLGPVAVRIENDRPWWTPPPPTAPQYGARAYNYAAEAPARGSETTAQVDVEYAYAR